MEIKCDVDIPEKEKKALVEMSLFFKTVLEGRKDDKDMIEAFEGISAVKEQNGEKSLFLCKTNKDYLIRLIMCPDDMFMEVSKDTYFCRALISKDCYANNWLKKKYS